MITVLEDNVGDCSAEQVEADIIAAVEQAKYPWAMGLIEVHDRRTVLKHTAKKLGAELFQFPGAQEGHVAMLVHPDLRPKNERVIKISDRTLVGKQVPGAGGTGYTAAKYILALGIHAGKGDPRTLGVTHLVPGLTKSDRAKALHELQARHCASWVARCKNPVDLMMDGNGEAHLPSFDALNRVAKPVSAPSWHGNEIDIHWLSKGAGVHVQAFEGHSDHSIVKLDWRV